MPPQFISECPVILPTLERAEKFVPPEFIPCYQWFCDHVGETISRLPHRMQNPPSMPIPLSRDAGIYVPSTRRVTYESHPYALSVHGSTKGRYNDRTPIDLGDGTWILDYEQHAGADTVQGYNGALRNCLEDGVPVGVMIRQNGGYLILGLAFVERYNALSGMFTLHGPISSTTIQTGSFELPELEGLAASERQTLIEYDGADERRFVEAQAVRREQQGRFRKELFEAYGGACAISGTDVSEVLQAAHINPYRGKHSQFVRNGILLRADLHLLYDAHLMTVDPDSHQVMLSDRLAGSVYRGFLGVRLREPELESLRPNSRLLDIHYQQFLQESAPLVA